MGANDEDGEADWDVEKADADWDQHQRAIYDLVQQYQEENDLDDAAVSMMLMMLGLNIRTTAYAMDVEKPSASGLKLDLDRFKRDIDSLFRESRKNAETFIETAKSVIEEAKLESDIAGDEDDDA